MGDVIFTGKYATEDGDTLNFKIYSIGDIYLVSLNGISEGIAKTTKDRAPERDGAIGQSFIVSQPEYDDFIENVINTSSPWILTNEIGGGIVLPGRWQRIIHFKTEVVTSTDSIRNLSGSRPFDKLAPAITQAEFDEIVEKHKTNAKKFEEERVKHEEQIDKIIKWEEELQKSGAVDDPRKLFSLSKKNNPFDGGRKSKKAKNRKSKKAKNRKSKKMKGRR